MGGYLVRPEVVKSSTTNPREERFDITEHLTPRFRSDGTCDLCGGTGYHSGEETPGPIGRGDRPGYDPARGCNGCGGTSTRVKTTYEHGSCYHDTYTPGTGKRPTE